MSDFIYITLCKRLAKRIVACNNQTLNAMCRVWVKELQNGEISAKQLYKRFNNLFL